jgi:hypothetical protein
MAAEWYHKGKPTALGLASGLVAGLATVTPASGFVHPLGALVIGLLAGVLCYVAVCAKPACKYDDSLDAFGVHGVGGFLGIVLTGVFASAVLYKAASGSDLPVNNPGGWLIDGHAAQVGVQLLMAVVVAAFSFVVTLVIVKVIDLTWGFCLDGPMESEGLDRCQHGEVGFDLGPALELAPADGPVPEPRAAMVPPNGQHRFTVVVDGVPPSELIATWSRLCQTGPEAPAPEFLEVYPFMTTVRGNRFGFRGGDPAKLRENLQRLFQSRLNGANIRAHVEN